MKNIIYFILNSIIKKSKISFKHYLCSIFVQFIPDIKRSRHSCTEIKTLRVYLSFTFKKDFSNSKNKSKSR